MKPSNPALRHSILAIALTLSGSVIAQVTDGDHPAEAINGPTVTNDPGVTVTATIPGVTELPGVSVTANVPSQGFALTPTGNGYTGRLYATANQEPASILSNNRNPCAEADPILPATGTKVETYPLFELPGEMGLRYILYYNGKGGWRDNLGYMLDTTCVVNPPDSGACKTTTLYRPDGSTIVYQGGPTATAYVGGGVNRLTRDASTGIYTLLDEDTTTQKYSPSGTLLSITDVSGVSWSFTTDANGLHTVTHSSGRSFTYSYAGGNTTITDPAGNVYSLVGVPEQGAVVSSITFPGAPATVLGFKYTSFPSPPYGYGLSEVDYNGTPYSYTTYDTRATVPNTTFPNIFYKRATGSYLGDGSENVTIAYGEDSSSNLQATITNALGHQSVKTFDANGNVTQISDAAVQTCGATVSGSTYDSNGYLSAEVDNNGSTHAYTYASNGQLQTETEAYGTALARTTNYVWDSNQQLNRLLSKTVVGWSSTTYAYNAQNRLASVTNTNLSSRGSVNQTLTTSYNYTLYSNGMVQTMSVTRPSPGGSDTDTYQYDTYGNIASKANGLGQTTSYSNYNALGQVGHEVGPNGDATDYTYDARGRLITKTTHPNGVAATWTYTYDGFGLLYTRTSPDGQVTTWGRDPSTMRVTSITHNDKDGSSTRSFIYDANGDVLESKVTRGSAVGIDRVMHYDALGRVYQKIGQNGQSLTYAYDGNGNTLSVVDAVGHSKTYQYDALNRVTQLSEAGGGSPSMPSGSPAINVPATNTSGAYIVSWNSLTGATYYVLQEKIGSGDWGTVQSNSSISWAAVSKGTNTYSYQVKACNATGCGSWSNTGSVAVSIPTAPSSAPSLTTPSSNNNGSYTVSWTAVANTSTYNLQEQVNGGSWNSIQNNTSLSWSVGGKVNGTYAYRAQACNAVGCGSWSNTGTTVVTWPPIPANPTLNWQSYNYTGSYTVSWNSVPNATSYQLNMSSNGGSSWTQVLNSGATSWTAGSQGNGTYYYALVACNISGCSAATGAAVLVTIPTPIPLNSGGYWATNVVSVSGNEGIGFDVVNGNTWEVFHTTPGNTHVVNSSGSLPYRAVSVQYTWTSAGVPTGYTDALGSVTSNGASSPVSVGSNPSTLYVTGTFNKNGDHAHSYQLRIDFFDDQGHNVSSTTTALTAEVTGNQ